MPPSAAIAADLARLGVPWKRPLDYLADIL